MHLEVELTYACAVLNGVPVWRHSGVRDVNGAYELKVAGE